MTEKSRRLLNAIKTTRLYFDGGMGTLLQKMNDGRALDEKVSEIIKAYVGAGSNIVVTNTFGLSKENPNNLEEQIKTQLELAHAAVGQNDVYVAFDLGPTGRLMAPMGDLCFDEAVEYFSRSARLAQKYGADLIAIETMTDLEEIRAAVVACKTSTDLPVFATNAYAENGRLFTGATPREAVRVLETAGVDALGTNCSFGPDKLLPVVEELVKYASVPVIVCPNAGMPTIQDGVATYNIDADEFADYMRQIAQMGAGILGGCCGTTPEYIIKTIAATNTIPYKYPDKKNPEIFETEESGEQRLVFDSPLKDAIFDGDDDLTKEETLKLLSTVEPLDIINKYIIPVLDEVGREFEEGNLFISELIMCAQTAAVSFNEIKARLPKVADEKVRKMILATVKGDVHDIGKDIVKTLLESYCFEVIDLGIDVSSERLVKAVADNNCHLVGLSALMTTTVPAMEAAIKALHEADPKTKVVVGGAVLTPQLAKKIGADYYGSNAMSTVDQAVDFYTD